MNKDTLVFMGFFFEALKPHTTQILDAAITISDAALSASVKADVRLAQVPTLVNIDTLEYSE